MWKGVRKINVLGSLVLLQSDFYPVWYTDCSAWQEIARGGRSPSSGLRMPLTDQKLHPHVVTRAEKGFPREGPQQVGVSLGEAAGFTLCPRPVCSQAPSTCKVTEICSGSSGFPTGKRGRVASDCVDGKKWIPLNDAEEVRLAL